MLGWIVERTKMGKIAGQWASATQLDPGDRGQVAVMASGLIKSAGMRLEDAWLSALVNWTHNHPDPESKFVLATGIIRFLDIYGHSAGLSPECRDASREVAESLVGQFVLFNPAIRIAGERFAAEERANEEALRQEEKKRNLELRIKMNEQRYVKPAQPAPPLPIAGHVSKGEAYRHALDFLSLRLCEDGYGIAWMGDSRGDVPSLIAEKGGVSFHVLLHLEIAPTSTNPAPFVLNRFRDEATAAGAYLRIAKIIAFNRLAQSEAEKGNVTGENLGFLFTGLEAI